MVIFSKSYSVSCHIGRGGRGGGRVEVYFCSFFNLGALDGVRGHRRAPDAFPPGKGPGAQCRGDLVGLGADPYRGSNLELSSP